jgi:hypothetical protein
MEQNHSKNKEVVLGCVWCAKKYGTEQDNFSCIVFDFKTVLGNGQTGCSETGQKLKFLSSADPWDNFCPLYKLYKISK